MPAAPLTDSEGPIPTTPAQRIERMEAYVLEHAEQSPAEELVEVARERVAGAINAADPSENCTDTVPIVASASKASSTAAAWVAEEGRNTNSVLSFVISKPEQTPQSFQMSRAIATYCEFSVIIMVSSAN